MESIIVYAGLSFLIIWIIGFSLSMAAVLVSEFLHLAHRVNNQLDLFGRQLSDWLHRLLSHWHLVR